MENFEITWVLTVDVENEDFYNIKENQKTYQLQSRLADVLFRWPRVLSTVKQISTNHVEK